MRFICAVLRGGIVGVSDQGAPFEHLRADENLFVAEIGCSVDEVDHALIRACIEIDGATLSINRAALTALGIVETPVTIGSIVEAIRGGKFVWLPAAIAIANRFRYRDHSEMTSDGSASLVSISMAMQARIAEHA
jgi:hypothetical protein